MKTKSENGTIEMYYREKKIECLSYWKGKWLKMDMRKQPHRDRVYGDMDIEKFYGGKEKLRHRTLWCDPWI